ncbi:hypothetical protein SERLA73DRAFT_182546 [Serpula lacrymans var. lacrymans S7.3]|uniref:Uncharacterized protein n=1 Tax=Serpula lacrymans var. lacrymans (strain S7.3) TaxID=936435 RepID=F8Q0G8_SERL3|nr:hypothetical protein SERLA73DRAFT_182546 [Serpula lacrymans var. lacrymans S7.3]
MLFMLNCSVCLPCFDAFQPSVWPLELNLYMLSDVLYDDNQWQPTGESSLWDAAEGHQDRIQTSLRIFRR